MFMQTIARSKGKHQRLKVKKASAAAPSIILLLLLFLIDRCDALTVAVFGGSGYIGRRICQRLIHEQQQEGAKQIDKVISISQSGRPPSYYCDPSWSDHVEWKQMDIGVEESINEQQIVEKLHLPHIDVAISCVGNVQPRPNWEPSSFFGLSFDDDKLRHENGAVNERICHIAKNAGAQRFVYVSVSYEVAKALEGPLEGYLDGKRQAEHAACELFGEDNTIIIGPSLVYGGKRFVKFGNLYKAFVESSIAKAYTSSNDALRSASTGGAVEDWVEKMIFSPPVEVHTVAKVICAAAIGQVTRATTGPRRQGFFSTLGQPVTYDNVVFVDGTDEIERIAKEVHLRPFSIPPVSYTVSNKDEPSSEGGLIGKGPFMFPLPVIAIFTTIFYNVATSSFLKVVAETNGVQ